MGKMIFELDEKLEAEFRKTVYEKRGLHKGVIKASLEEALQEWVKKNKSRGK